jgi:MFS family permease
MMKYALLIYTPTTAEDYAAAAKAAVAEPAPRGGWVDYTRAAREAGVLVAAEQLTHTDTATSVRAFLTAQYFQLGLGYSPLATGLRLLPWTATPMVVAPLAGALADRIGNRPLLVAGLLMRGAGLAWVASLAVTTAGGGYGRFVLPLIVAGVGVSMTLPTAPTAVLSAVPASDVGRASGVSNTMQRFGGAFGIAVVAAVFAAHGHFGSAASFTSGYRPAMVVSALISLGGAVAAVAVGRRGGFGGAGGFGAGAPAQVPGRAVVPSHEAAGDVPATANTGADAS